ncbi:hypothetical protein ACK5EC_005718 [Klebsiella oxytoca]
MDMDEKKEAKVKEKEDELIKRAEILFDHQKKQYELSVDGLRKLEDKAMKIFSALSIIITITILIVRNWWIDIFPGKYYPLHAICWASLLIFIALSLISWGFVFSAMQPKDFERPSSDPNHIEALFMKNKRYDSLSSYAREYSRLTGRVDQNHVEKVKMIMHCSESMLFGAWEFVIFLLTFLLIKFNQ